MDFIINLTEIYKNTGGRDGRQAENLKETAACMFKKNKGSGGSAFFQGDRYFLLFNGVGD